MSARKPWTSGRRLSVKDMVIDRFEKNKERIKHLTEENNRIKEQWKHCGSFSTHNFDVVVGRTRKRRTMSMKKGVEMYGKAFMKYTESFWRWDFRVTRKEKV